jgi:hypothetical protein
LRSQESGVQEKELIFSFAVTPSRWGLVRVVVV